MKGYLNGTDAKPKCDCISTCPRVSYVDTSLDRKHADYGLKLKVLVRSHSHGAHADIPVHSVHSVDHRECTAHD